MSEATRFPGLHRRHRTVRSRPPRPAEADRSACTRSRSEDTATRAGARPRGRRDPPRHCMSGMTLIIPGTGKRSERSQTSPRLLPSRSKNRHATGMTTRAASRAGSRVAVTLRESDSEEPDDASAMESPLIGRVSENRRSTTAEARHRLSEAACTKRRKARRADCLPAGESATQHTNRRELPKGRPRPLRQPFSRTRPGERWPYASRRSRRARRAV